MIHLDQITFRYPHGEFELRIPQLAVEAGESMAFTGPSGSGKTTLLNLIAGISVPDSGTVTANASVVTYNRISPENRDSFHFHGDLSGYPVTGVIAAPRDERSAAILRGRYEGKESEAQMVVPAAVVGDLLDTIFTVRRYLIAAVALVGLSTLATATLVFMLSIRLRRREIETLHRIGGSRRRVAAMLASEVVIVVGAALILAGALTLLTAAFGTEAIRALLLG